MTSGDNSDNDARAYRKFFAVRWQRFICNNFASPTHVADVFKVDLSTAENWWAGHNAPQGWVVGRAIADPEMTEKVIHLLKEG